MGRRRAHLRVDDKGDGQKAGHRRHEAKLSKPKPLLFDENLQSNGMVYERSRVSKRGNKRKVDDVTRKGDAQRRTGKDSPGISKKFSRWKSFSGSDSDLSSGNGSDSSMRFRNISNSSCSGHITDGSDSNCSREQTGKRFRAHPFEDGQIIETVKEERRKRASPSTRRDESICNSRLKTSSVVEGQTNKFIDGQTGEVGISTALEQDKGLLDMNLAREEAWSTDGAIMPNFLEIELRQKALANLMRHRDSSGGRKVQKESYNAVVPINQGTEKEVKVVEEIRASTNQSSTLKGGNEIVKGPTAETGNVFSVTNLINDGEVDQNRWPLASDIAPRRTHSLEPKQDAMETSTPSRDVSSKLVAVSDIETVRKSDFEEKTISRGSSLLCSQVINSSEKGSLLPSENESQPETKPKLRNTDEISRHRDLCKDLEGFGEENISGMTDYLSEVVKADTSQAEAKGNTIISESFSTDAAHVSESIGLPYEKVHSSLEKEKQGSNDKAELLKSDESMINMGQSKEQSNENTGYHAVTSVRQNSPGQNILTDSFRECGKDHTQSVTKYETATQKQEDGASMFQQKTMSVMRGGELVQVNYKVYIPKRAAELAKRRLRR